MKIKEFIERISKTQDNNVLVKKLSGDDYLSLLIMESIQKSEETRTGPKVMHIGRVDAESVVNDLNYAISQLKLACDEALRIKEEEEEAEEEQMQDFEIPVRRIAYGFNTIKVRATSREEAERLALEEAGDHEFSEKNVDYETGN